MGRKRFAACLLIPLSTVMVVATQGTGASGQPDSVTVNGGTSFQTISGFGSSEGFYEARILMGLPAAERSQILNLLYNAKTGAGLTILRNQIGATASYGTIEPTAPSSPSATPTYVPLGNDDGQEWLASTLKHEFKIKQFIADAWSAPAFMKTNDSDTEGGTLCGVPGATCASGDWRQAYANYLVQYAEDYRADGLPLEYIGFVNEPTETTDYSSMNLTPAQAANFADVFGPILTSAHKMTTKLECCDTVGWDSANEYAPAIEADSHASSYVKIFTSHGYTAAPAAPLSGWSEPAWETEWSTFDTFDPAWDDDTDASGLTWAQNIYNGLTSANLSAFFYWYGADFYTTDNQDLIEVQGSTVTPSARLWAFANYSRFVRPGAVRVAAASSDNGLEVTAFKNTDKKVAIVALNTNASPVTVTFSLDGSGMPESGEATPYVTDGSSDTASQSKIRITGATFSATIPARALATYEMKG
jgi:O-glycosyl hydrolase